MRVFFSHFYRSGVEVMEIVASWTKSLCIEISQGHIPDQINDAKCGCVFGNLQSKGIV